MQHWIEQSELHMYMTMFPGKRMEGCLKVSLSRGLIKILLGNLPLSTVLQSASVGLGSYSEFLISLSGPGHPARVSPLQGFPILLRRSLAPVRTTGNKDKTWSELQKETSSPSFSSLRIDFNQTAAFNQSLARKEKISPFFWWVFLPFLKQIKPSPFIPCYSCHQSDHLFTQRPLLLLVSVKNQVSGILEGNTLHRQLSLFVVARFLWPFFSFCCFNIIKWKYVSDDDRNAYHKAKYFCEFRQPLKKNEMHHKNWRSGSFIIQMLWN